MRTKLAVVMMVVLALAACQGERASVTGEYGAAVVSGQVVMADGSSPAGVTVSLRGSGHRAVLAADGQFAFAGAPEGGELVFERAGDGVSASMRLEQGVSAAVIELTKTTATQKSSKRRSGGRGGSGVAVPEFEGVIRSVSATSLVLFTSKQVEQTIALDAATIIRKGRTTLTAADLKVGARVHVKAKAVEGGGYLATIVMLQNDGTDDGDDDSPEGREYEGITVSATDAQLVIRDQRNGEVTFVLTATTDIRKGNTPMTAAQILPGTRVHVKATSSADGATKTATRVIVQNTNGGGSSEVKVSGTVASISGTTLTLTGEDGTVTVTTDATTKVVKKKSAIALTDIVAGDRVKVEGTRVDATTVLAREIEVK